MQATLVLWRELRRWAWRLVTSAALGAALIASGQPAQALALRLDWALGFEYPPNPCIAGSALSTTGFG
ncbi:MAG: hypothetical protein KDG44_05940, partial [Burkholderiaceae bacterium]|nr:hypothetical protein [Burkholderiaceae bacterium]